MPKKKTEKIKLDSNVVKLIKEYILPAVHCEISNIREHCNHQIKELKEHELYRLKTRLHATKVELMQKEV